MVIGTVAGAGVGLMVSLAMSIIDWRLNPAGLFHNQDGTNWAVFFETAFSWFWPVFLIVFVLTAIVHSKLSRDGNA